MSKAKDTPPVEELACVLYTDGGCRPGKKTGESKGGIGGWGVHGYLYEKTASKTGLGLKDWVASPIGYQRKDTPLTNEDGAWVAEFMGHRYDTSQLPLPNVEVIGYIDGFGSILPESTNNHAEVTALYNTLIWVLNYTERSDVPIKDLFILADSEYTINGFSKWLSKWEAANYTKPDGKKYANEASWRDIAKLKEQCREKGINIKMRWVAGHSGDLGNDLADYHATNGHYTGIKDITFSDIKITPSKGYWSPPTDTHPLMTHSRWYFGTHTSAPTISASNHYVYHIGTHGKEDDFAGKAIADASFAVLYLKEPIAAFETIRQYQHRLEAPNFHHLVATRLDNLSKASIRTAIASYGDLFLRTTKVRNDIVIDTPFMEKEVGLTREFKPPKIATRLIDVLNEIESLLEDTVFNKAEHLGVVDITTTFFDIAEKGKKSTLMLKKEINNTLKSLVVDVESTLGGTAINEAITLTFGIDLPNRNSLAKLTDIDTKVFLVCWPVSSKAIRFGSIVQHNGEYGFWCGPYSNIHILSE